jgi:hypothetical protein
MNALNVGRGILILALQRLYSRKQSFDELARA